jgi:hypothetical protein
MAEPLIVCKNQGGDVTVHGECRVCHAVAGESCRTEKPAKSKPMPQDCNDPERSSARIGGIINWGGEATRDE